MAIKRRRRKKRELLDGQRSLDLILDRSRTVDKNSTIWHSPLERRAAWYAHKHEFLNKEWLEGYPGTRPGGWWAYEHPDIEGLPGEEDWELLIRAGEVKEAERNMILARWVRNLHLRKGYLKTLHNWHTEGREPYHGEKPWPEELGKLERQARLLGPAAEKELRAILTKITGEKEEES
jgi:hypothetical protein